MAQADTKFAISKDSVSSDKDNLKLLTERLYLAFKAYRTGVYEFEVLKSDSIRALHIESAKKDGRLINLLERNDRIIYPVILRGEELVSDIIYLNLDEVPSDSVQSIEVMDIGRGISVLHGLRSGGIVIRLKE